MVTIQQTVDIPADRRLTLEVPETVPHGKSTVKVIFTPINGEKDKTASLGEVPQGTSPKKATHTNYPQDLREAQIELAFKTMPGHADKDPSRTFAGCLKGKNVFKGDPVEIQRKMRDEW
jgi:hypothetical protein